MQDKLIIATNSSGSAASCMILTTPSRSPRVVSRQAADGRAGQFSVNKSLLSASRLAVPQGGPIRNRRSD